MPTNIVKDKNLEFVYFSPINWDFIWQRPQSLALELARLGHRVVFVDPVRPLPKFIYFKQKLGARACGDGISAIGPAPQFIGDMGPAKLWGVEDRISRLHTTPALRKAVSPESILIVGAPNWAHRVNWNTLPHRLLCYDCIDFIEGMFSGKKSEAIREMEDEMIRRADIIFATHPELARQIDERGKAACLVPNGASVEKFLSAEPTDKEWVKKLPRPIVGYVGAVAQWIDQSLIRIAAERHPEWSFVVIGPTLRKTSRTALLGLPNVHRLGQVSHDEVASYVRLFDICIAPFKAGSVADHTDPVKVYEYLACGKPVVAANVPSLSKLDGLLYSTSGVDDFLAGLESAASETDPTLPGLRTEFAREHSWQRRAQTIVETVERELGR